MSDSASLLSARTASTAPPQDEAALILAKAARFAPPGPRTAEGKLDLIGLSREALTEAVAELGEPPFRAKQIWHWLYHRGARQFAEMTSLSRAFRARLEERCVIGRPERLRALKSADQSEKFLLGLADGERIETVYIPDLEEERGAVCLSTQVGCTLSCRFCHTGTQRLERNLSAAEIVGQFLALRDYYGEWPTPREGEPRRLATIVVMGMGEPLYNYENVATALTILMDPEGVALSRRRITLSTSGVVPLIDRVGRELGVNLAISLHAVRDDLRDELVPLNRKYPIAELLAACRRYPRLSNARRITFEYIMLKGINDSPADAKELVRLIAGIPAKVNLIPFNPWPGSRFEPSPEEAIRRFAEIINDAGYAAPVRTPRGRDILAACGQLRTAAA
jgi:23S rRNA (adenine2503-C2)-methyltransferase